jgi:hypothetical protein
MQMREPNNDKENEKPNNNPMYTITKASGMNIMKSTCDGTPSNNSSSQGKLKDLGMRISAFFKEKLPHHPDKIDPSKIRSIIASEGAKYLNEKQQKDLASSMLHSHDVHQLYYVKRSSSEKFIEGRQSLNLLIQRIRSLTKDVREEQEREQKQEQEREQEGEREQKRKRGEREQEEQQDQEQENEYEVERINKKKIGEDGRLWVLVKWVGFVKPTWVPFANIHNALEKYEEFEIENMKK